MTNAPPGPPGPPLLPMKHGTVLTCGTVVQKYLGRSEGGLSYFGEHPEHGRVVVKDVAVELQETFRNLRDEVEALIGIDHHSVQRLISIGERQGHPYLVYQYVRGQNLSRAMEQLGKEGPPQFRAVYNVLGHATTALEAMHEIAPHGVLTSSNVYVGAGGQVTVANAGFARIMLCALGSGSEAFRQSPYLAPEVIEDPWSASETSDIYSLGVLAVGLLAGKVPTRENLAEMRESVTARYPEQVKSLLDRSLELDAALRIASVVEFREELARALAAVRTAAAAKPSGEQPKPDLNIPTPKSKDLFAGIALPPMPSMPAGGGDGDEERWIINRHGRDYGPYTVQEIHDKLEADEIDENTTILDIQTQELASLIDVPTFTDYVMDYIPRREQRRIEEQERRDENVRQVKRKSTTLIVTAGIGVAALFAAFIYLIRAQPVAYPVESAARPFRSVFEVAEPEYAGIAADEDLIASLFNFDEPAEPERSGRSGSRRGSSGGGDGDDDEGYDEVSDDYVLDFDSSRPARRLSQDEINRTLRDEAYRLQRCFEAEMRQNPRFRGAELTWSIHPDGRVFNVRAEGNMSDSTESCLTRQFRRIRFPQFNDVPMSVRYPFYVQ